MVQRADFGSRILPKARFRNRQRGIRDTGCWPSLSDAAQTRTLTRTRTKSWGDPKFLPNLLLHGVIHPDERRPGTLETFPGQLSRGVDSHFAANSHFTRGMVED